MQRFHANVIRLESCGLLIFGDSGSGKSALSRALLDRAEWFGRARALVADDYCDVDCLNGRLVACAPESLKGAMEIRGAGLFAVDHDDKAVLTHAVHLHDTPERYPSGQIFEFEGAVLPKLFLPSLNKVDVVVLCQAIEAFLFRTPWDMISHT